jgi:hypothetical protein
MKVHQIPLIAVLLAASTAAFAQDAPPSAGGAQAVIQWLQQQATASATNSLNTPAAKTTAAMKKPSQTQSISIDHGSTTFVDQTSGADLVSGALNLAGLGGGNTGGTGSGTVSASLYSLYALANKTDPLTPSFYIQNQWERQLFFTVGRAQEQQGSTTQNPANLGTIVGVKWLPFNRRDASSIIEDEQVHSAISQAAAKFPGPHSVSVVLAILRKNLRGDQRLDSVSAVQSAVDALPSADKAAVDQEVANFTKENKVAEEGLNALVTKLKSRTQVAISFQTTQRGAGQNDDYQGELIVDRGFGSKLFATLNGSYDYSASSKVGGDVRSGRGAAELRWDLTPPSGSSTKKALELALSGEGVLKSSMWQYRAQLQLSIPITSGVDLPVSFGYGNDPTALMQQEKSVYGKFGITFDLQKVAGLLTGSH